jgi:phage tail-like protein
MPANQRDDPFPCFNLLVEIDGVSVAGFLSADGIEGRIEVSEYRNGNEDTTPRHLPGKKSFGNIILRRGLTKDSTLWQWFKTALDGKIERRSGSITVLDEERRPAVRFHFREAWPCRLKYSDLNAMGSGVAIEEIEIVIEDLTVENS